MQCVKCALLEFNQIVLSSPSVPALRRQNPNLTHLWLSVYLLRVKCEAR